MIVPQKPLFSLTAADLMTPAVVTLPEGMRLPAAARFLRRQQVSGAPVVDQRGRCTGVLSTTDFMRWAEGHVPPDRGPFVSDTLGMEWQAIELEGLPHDEVREHMTSDSVTISPDTPLARMAELMVEAHIHRLIVVDADLHPVGVVATTDILAALIPGAGTNN